MNEEVLSKEQKALKEKFSYIEEIAESDTEKLGEDEYLNIVKKMYGLTDKFNDPELDIIANIYSCALIFKTLGRDPWNLLKEARERLNSYKWRERVVSAE